MIGETQFYGAQSRKCLWPCHHVRQSMSQPFMLLVKWIEMLLDDSNVSDILKIELLVDNKSTMM